MGEFGFNHVCSCSCFEVGPWRWGRTHPRSINKYRWEKPGEGENLLCGDQDASGTCVLFSTTILPQGGFTFAYQQITPAVERFIGGVRHKLFSSPRKTRTGTIAAPAVHQIEHRVKGVKPATLTAAIIRVPMSRSFGYSMAFFALSFFSLEKLGSKIWRICQKCITYFFVSVVVKFAAQNLEKTSFIGRQAAISMAQVV